MSNDFKVYLSKIKKWSFYFTIPEDCFTNEFLFTLGPENRFQYHFGAYAVNRYKKVLAGQIMLIMNGAYTGIGGIAILPFIPELEQKEAINLILEDLIGKPQQSLPPDWIKEVPMPLVETINAEIVEKKVKIELLLRKIGTKEEELAEIEKWKKLIYETGRELEKIFEEALKKLGAKTIPANAEEEFIFEHKEGVAVVECKGVSKSISLDHVRQTDSHVLKFIEAENRDAKGVLFGNTWRNLPPNERGKPDTPVFPSNVVKHASQRAISLVDATEFFDIFCHFLNGEISGQEILDSMLEQSGIVEFRK